MKLNLFFLLLLLPFFPENVAQSQKQEMPPLAIIETLQSRYLQENRILNIYLPPSYDPDSTTDLPVIYLLDGSANEDLLHIVGIVQFLNMYNVLPESIVVGIANVDRYRDFTTPSQGSVPKRGL